MNDQARSLREQVVQAKKGQNSIIQKEAKTIAVISGKGGVGKSNFSLNFSLCLQKRGFKVLLFDMDIGMANIDILLGSTERYTILDFFKTGSPLDQFVQKGPEGLSYIAGGSGLTDIFQFDEKKRNNFLSQLQEISFQYDYILFDMGAGLTADSLQIILACNETFLVTTCEPTAMTDAYSALKFIHIHDPCMPFQLIINRAMNERHAKTTAERLQSVTKQFLQKDLIHLGTLPDDKYVSMAVMAQTPFVLKFPTSKASRGMEDLTLRYVKESNSPNTNNRYSFMTKLRKLFR